MHKRQQNPGTPGTNKQAYKTKSININLFCLAEKCEKSERSGGKTRDLWEKFEINNVQYECGPVGKGVSVRPKGK